MFNFGQAIPKDQQKESPRLNDELFDAGIIGGDIASFFPRGRGGGIGGMVSNAMVGAAEFRDGNYFAAAGDFLASGLSGVQAVNPRLAASMPGLGVAQGLAFAGGYGAEAIRNIEHIDGGYQNNPFWENAGWATLGGLQAAAALDPTGISSLYVNGGALALDGIGALAGMIDEDWYFNSGSAIGAAEHLVFDTGQAIGQGAMWAGERIADGASDAWSGAKDLASNVGTGVGNAARNVWSGAGNLANRAGGAISRGASAAGNAISRGASAVGSAASGVGRGISNAATNVWNGAGDVANHATSAVSNAASNTWNAVSDW